MGSAGGGAGLCLIFFLGLCKFSFFIYSFSQDFTALKVSKREAAVPTPQRHKHLEP